MPTFIKPGFWRTVKKGYKDWLNLDQLITKISNNSFQGIIVQTEDDVVIDVTHAMNITSNTSYINGNISFPNLISVERISFIDSNRTPYLYLPKLQSIKYFQPNNIQNTVLDLSSLKYFMGGGELVGNNLENVIFSSDLILVNNFFFSAGSKLSQSCVDNILHIVATGGYLNTEINLNYENNAAPSAQGLLDVDIIIANGGSVNHN